MMVDEIIDPYPPIIRPCDICGCFKMVLFTRKLMVCHGCLRELEEVDGHLGSDQDRGQERDSDS